MILYGISGVDWSACGRMNSRIERSSRIDRSIAYFVLCEHRAPIFDKSENKTCHVTAEQSKMNTAYQ